jgi:soluble lytic murein transglycosylase
MNARNLALLALTAIPLFMLKSTTLEASRARPRVVAASENVRLAIPRALTDTSEKGAMGLDSEDADVRERALQIGAKYLQVRRQPRTRRSFDKECEKLLSSDPGSTSLQAAFCGLEADRNKKAESNTSVRRTKAERRDVADQLFDEHWDAVSEIPYQSVVGIVGAFKTQGELMQMGRALGSKTECVGSKAATAIAYKLEEYFPDPEVVKISRQLYSYASGCGTDFAAAKAAYRLALLDIWQNQCDRVPELMMKVEQNPDSSQFRSRAKYGRAYCSEILGQKDSSREAREALLFDYPMTFHNLAANSNQGHAIDWITRDVVSPIAFRSLVRPEKNGLLTAIEVMVKLKAIDLAAEIVDRQINAIQQFEPEVRLYVAALMHKHSQALPKFKILSSLFQDSPGLVSGATMRLYFPLWFFDIIGPQSGATLDPLLVTALIRQESAFNTHARSRVGARGLMQLMPATAKMLAKVRTSKLYDPETNIALGTQYLRKRLAQYDGDVELTLAAYNAGFSRVDEWKRRYPTENRILFLDLIPFRETRDYVSSILRNYYWYTKLYGTDAVVALQRSMHKPSVAAKTLTEAPVPRDVAATVDLSSTFQAITRAQAGLVTAIHNAVSPATAKSTTNIAPASIVAGTLPENELVPDVDAVAPTEGVSRDLIAPEQDPSAN